MKQNDSNIAITILDWHQQGRKIAIASVVETWGSAPQPVGSQLLIDEQGHFVGSVSGGCVEGAVVGEASEIFATGKPVLLTFSVSDQMAWDVGLSCGGKIRVFIESFDDDKAVLLKQIIKYQRGRVPCVLVSDFSSGTQRLVSGQDYSDDDLASELGVVFATGESAIAKPDAECFLHLYDIPLKLVIVGAVHIAQSLVPIAKMAGFDVVVVDPRESFANAARFGDVTLMAKWPDEALDEFDLDSRTALVVLSHDPKIDDPALRIGLASDCFYIGALGSRKTHGKRLERLSDVEGLERIDGPIGLDIGAKGAAEIAISIVGKLIETLRRGN